MLLFLANNVETIEQIYELHAKCPASAERSLMRSSEIDVVAPREIVLICNSTTLSGGEYSWFTCGTDPSNYRKIVLQHPWCGARLLVLDPALSITTPRWVWLSSGVRAIDHCVESFCRIRWPDAEVDAATLQAFRQIVPGLLRTMQDWENEEARLQTMIGVSRVMIMLKKEAWPGASHGIGHQLGPLGVGHGQTSCILLPSVMKYNKRVNGHKQDVLKETIWGEDVIREVLLRRGLHQESSDVGDALDAIFREMGMPRSLKEVGVGRDKFDLLATNSLTDSLCAANPIPMTKKEQVLEILEMCAE